MSFSPNTSFGRYKLLTHIGAGGMGEVYSARDTQLEVLVGMAPATKPNLEMVMTF